MAVKIRLRQQGRTNRQTYRVVAANVRSPRDGKYIEMLGWYTPFQDENNVSVNEERIRYWIGQGAMVSEQVATILARTAPSILKEMKQKEQAKKAKLAAKRRAAKKK